MSSDPRSAKAWLAVFGLWGMILTGAFSPVISSPGVIQAIRLAHLLKAKQAQADQLEQQLDQLSAEKSSLQQNPAAQEQAVRSVLGYAAPDELIFDFTNTVSN